MPFENIASGDADRLAGLLPSSARAQAAGAMTYVDRVVAVLDAAQYRFALAQAREPADAATAAPPPPPPPDASAEAAAAATAKESTVRPHLYPSLFLHSLRDVVEYGWGDGRSAAERRQLARHYPAGDVRPQLLSRSDAVHDGSEGSVSSLVGSPRAITRPPPWLLADGAAPPTFSFADAVATPENARAAALAPPPTTMYTLDLARDRTRARRDVVTALQAEVSLAVASGEFTSTLWDADAQTGDEPHRFLMSPDATTCVIVACRVSLHPRWREHLAASAPAQRPADSARADSQEETDQCFLRRAAATHTAAMAHLDRPEGARAVLHRMLWEAAVPGWLHAFTPSPDAHAAALARLHTLLPETRVPSSAPSPSPSPLLQVEWYLVGGLRVPTCSTAILTEVFAAFFPAPGAPRTSPSTDSEQKPLLSTSATLRSVLGDSSTAAGAAAAEESAITLSHRLREDALCCWSFNSLPRRWRFDKNPRNLYAFPVCYGLIIDVGTGIAWPCQLQPGTRDCVLPAVRALTVAHGYRCTFPLQSEASLRVVVQARTYADELNSCWLHDLLSASSSSSSSSASASASAALATVRARCAVAAAAAAAGASLGHGEEGASSPDDEKEKEEKEEEGKNSPVLHLTLSRFVSLGRARAAAQAQAPLLLRSPSAEDAWQQLSLAGGVKNLAAVPDEQLLQSSTSPHCEPADYAEMTRCMYAVAMSVGGSQAFQQLGSALAGQGPCDGVLLV